MFIHGSLGTGALSNSPALYVQFNVFSDPHGSTSPCSAHASDGPQPVRAMQGRTTIWSCGRCKSSVRNASGRGCCVWRLSNSNSHPSGGGPANNRTLGSDVDPSTGSYDPTLHAELTLHSLFTGKWPPPGVICCKVALSRVAS